MQTSEIKRKSVAVQGICLAAALVLSACGSTEGLFVPGEDPEESSIPTSVTVFDGAMRVRLPDGYCVSAGDSLPAKGFVLAAPCRQLDGEKSDVSHWVTLQYGAPGSAMITGQELAVLDYLTSVSGAALLGDDVAISGSNVLPSGIVLQVTDAAPNATLPPVQWRGFGDARDRLVTVGIRAEEGTDADGEMGQRIVVTFLETLAKNRRLAFAELTDTLGLQFTGP